jgi:hypothetical protein
MMRKLVMCDAAMQLYSLGMEGSGAPERVAPSARGRMRAFPIYFGINENAKTMRFT